MVVGVDHRNQPRVTRTLDVVLSPQRMQARSGLPHVAGQQCERNQTAGIIRPEDVLGDPHSPEQDRALRSPEHSSHFTNLPGIDSADLRCTLRCVGKHRLSQGLEIVGPRSDKVLIDESLFYDDVHHRVIEGDIGPRLDPAVIVRVVRDRLASRIHHDQLRPELPGLLEEGGGYGVVGGGVCSG